MKRSPASKTTARPPRAAILLLMTIIDTTWRAFVPTIGLTIVGVWLDNIFGIAPIMTSIFVPVGFVLAGVLVALQIRAVRGAQ